MNLKFFMRLMLLQKQLDLAEEKFLLNFRLRFFELVKASGFVDEEKLHEFEHFECAKDFQRLRP